MMTKWILGGMIIGSVATLLFEYFTGFDVMLDLLGSIGP